MSMKLFQLRRIEDVSGVSGTGIVAQGVQFANGKCALSWLTKYTSIAVYDTVEDLKLIHEHNGKTRLEWVHHFEIPASQKPSVTVEELEKIAESGGDTTEYVGEFVKAPGPLVEPGTARRRAKAPKYGSPPDCGSICIGCARTLGGMMPIGAVNTYWQGKCGVCGNERNCCCPTDYDWPDGTKHVFD